MTSSRGRSNADNLKLLEQLRPTFEKLRAERIRAESDIERLEQELEEARAEARAELGTDDEEEIRRLIAATETENAALVQEFAATIRAIEQRLKELEA